VIRVLHITPTLSLAGSTRSLCAIAKHLRSLAEYQHTVASLLPRQDQQRRAEEGGVLVLDAPTKDVLRQHVDRADIVHVEWWNNAAVYDFLRTDWPSMRLLVFCHVAGDASPNLITPQLVDFSDFWVSGCGYAHRHPVIQQLPPAVRREKTAVVTATADLDRLSNLRRKPHATFNVAYVGSVDFKKLHPEFVAMSAMVQAPNARFIVCGEGHLDVLQRQAEDLGVAARFQFRGHVEAIRSVFEIADVYGYPLCVNPGAELSLQEAMFAGVPPVVFPMGGIVDAVRHEQNGMLVHNEKEYAQAIDYLYEHPQQRRRMGQAARAFALQHFGGACSASKLHRVYQMLLRRPKRRHVWQPSTNQSVAAADRRGAEFFVESLGSVKTPYYVSLYGKDAAAVLAADAEIARQTALERVLLGAYRDFYPQDSCLRYWLELAWQYEGKHERASAEFSQAQLDGSIGWRLTWRRAQLAATLGEREQAVEFCRLVLNQHADFAPALRLATQLA
jgi:glycosyltransferase involved in cell wall biosynthesis